VEDRGARVVFVTGRPPRWMAEVAKATGHTGLAVCANGAVLYDLAREQVVNEIALQASDLAIVTERLLEALPGVAFAVDRFAASSHEPAYVTPWDDEDFLVVERDELFREPATKLLVRNPSYAPDDFLARAQEAVGELASITRSSADELIEIAATGVTKASGLEHFARTHGVSAAEVIAFGDMPNDLPMLEWVGHAVAVANAHPDVLALADEVTASNDDDGVAQVLERIFR
jgi:Cof subfamily protein (haloacid dehalogenase superfamily)